MIILTIGEASRRLAGAAAIEESWVTFHMRASALESAPPGVHVRIAAPSLALNLSAGEQCSADGWGRPVTRLESRIVELWQQRGLDRPHFRSGQLVAFLHQLYDVLEQGSVVSGTAAALACSVGAGLHGSGAQA